MPITSSSIKAITKGFIVLLVESNKKSLQHHAYVLLQNSYRVISTMKASEALSMILSKNTYDCVLIDAENRDMDLVDFLHTIWSHQPRLRVVVMTSNESYMQLARETLPDDTIWFLRKPCGGSIICNMLQHVCKRGLAFEEGISTRKFLGKNQEYNVIQRVDNMKPSTIFNITMINNNTSSINAGTHQRLNMNTHTYDAMFKPIAYVDISSDDDDDDATTNKNLCTSTTQNKDKGKQPMELKRNDDINLQMRKDFNTRIAWTPALHGKFLEALAVLGKQGAYPTAILKHMNVPGLTRAQVASHLQRIQERQNLIMKPRVVAGRNQKDSNLAVDSSYGCKRSGQSTPIIDHNKASRLKYNSHPQRALIYNSTGISCMNLNSIRNKLQGGPPPVGKLPLLPKQITTTCVQTTKENCSSATAGDQVIISGTNANNIFPTTNFVDTTFINPGLAQFDRFGIPVESSGSEAPLFNIGMDDLTFQDFISNDSSVCHPQAQGNVVENLFVVDESDTITKFGNGSTGFSVHSISGVENKSEEQVQPVGNSIIPLDGSEGRIIDNDWYMNLLHQDQYEDLFWPHQ